MHKLLLAVPCCRVIIDQATNMVSFIDVLDGAVRPAFPSIAPVSFIGTIWQLGARRKIEVRVRVYAPDGSQVADGHAAPMEVAPNVKRARIVIALGGFTLSRPGTYGFGVEVKRGDQWEEATRIPFDIELADASRTMKVGH